MTGGQARLATSGTLAFYKSLGVRYWKVLVGMFILMSVYAGVQAARLLFSGVLMDAVMVHFKVPPGRFIGRVDAAWAWLAGPNAGTVSERLLDQAFFLQFLEVTVGIFALIAVILGVTFFLKEYFVQLLMLHMSVDIRSALFSHLSRQSVAYFNRQRSGDLISRLTIDVAAVQASFRFFLRDIIQQPLTILSGFSVAIIASPLLFLIVFPFYAVLMLPVIRAGKRVRKHGKGSLEKLGLVTESIEQLFSGIRIVKAFGMERHEKEAFNERNKAYIRSTMKMVKARLVGRSLQEFLYNLGVATMVLFGVLAISRGWVEAPNFFIFLLALVQVYNPIKICSRAWNQIQQSRGGLDRVLAILQEKPLIQDRDGSTGFPGLEREIRFENVSFSYAKLDPRLQQAAGERLELPVLKDVSFSIRSGQVLALVGPSGSGKSTIVDLLARFYDPQQGSILVDGRDIRDYKHSSYLKALAIVSQDPFLFNTTIRENIRYGREDATEEEVEAAAKVAFAHDFILQQPEGYDTTIGSRGVMLSGGQRQRITIARAVLKNAQILILDEATSSLDSQAEQEVQRAVDNLVQRCTTFVIAHRLSTIVRADTIMVLDDGRIVERGQHEDLLDRKGRYYELWCSQNPDTLPGPERR